MILTIPPISLTDVVHPARLPAGVRLVTQYAGTLSEHEGGRIAMLITDAPIEWRMLGWIAYADPDGEVQITRAVTRDTHRVMGLQSAIDTLAVAAGPGQDSYLFGLQVQWIVRHPHLHLYAKRTEVSGRAVRPGGVYAGTARIFRSGRLYHAKHKKDSICTDADLGTVLLSLLRWGAGSHHAYMEMYSVIQPRMDRILASMRIEMPG